MKKNETRIYSNLAYSNVLFFIRFLLTASLRVMLGKKRKDIILKSRILGKVFLSRENETRDLVFFIAQQLHSYGFLKFLPHEKNVQKTLRILNGDLFIDVGANLGFYCFILNRNFKKIIAIEPHPGNVEEIIKSMKAFGIKNIECVQKAVSNLNGPLPLFISKGDSGHALGAWTKNGERIVVETVTMQTLLKNIRKVDLVKVDVEGAEWQVLDGSLQVIEKIKSWVIELHNLKRKTELENLLYSLNYSVKWLDYNHVFAWRRYR